MVKVVPCHSLYVCLFLCQDNSHNLSIAGVGSQGQPTIDDNTDLHDVRGRRIAIDQRFERRLEYLKARLKGAEIHERLLRK